MHFQAADGAADADGDAVAGQHRMVVHDRQAGRGEADPVAEQRRAGPGPGEVGGVERAERSWADALRCAGSARPAGQRLLVMRSRSSAWMRRYFGWRAVAVGRALPFTG